MEWEQITKVCAQEKMIQEGKLTWIQCNKTTAAEKIENSNKYIKQKFKRVTKVKSNNKNKKMTFKSNKT